MKILAICSPADSVDMDRFAQIIPAEAAAMRDLRSAGTLLEAWSPGRPGAVLILSASSVEEADTVMHRLPLVQAGLLSYELTPLKELSF